MIPGIQIIGFLFGLVMLYLTFLYYKRGDYESRSFVVWVCVWLFFLIMTMLPKTIYGLMETLKIERTADFFVVSGFLFFSLVIFYLFVTLKSMQKKIEKMVREIAIKKAK